jgi:formylglycine-generating enzyme required for sulfatase activity
LTRKQKETRRGRAELLLADRAAVWNTRPENRQLPSLLQWLQIRRWTQKKTWTAPQRQMMRKATRFYALRGLLVLGVVAVLAVLGLDGWGRLKAHTLRGRLLESTVTGVPGIVGEMAPYRHWVDPLLQQALAQAPDHSAQQLHLSLALLPVDRGQAEYLNDRLLQGQPEEVTVIRQALFDQGHDLTERWWTLLEDRSQDHDKRLRAACALARYAPQDGRWEQVSGDVAAQLAAQKAWAIGKWAEALQPAARWLLPPLAGFLEQDQRSGSERALIASLYGQYAAGQEDGFARLEKVLAEQSKANAAEDARIALARGQANVGAALLVMGHPDKVWPLLRHSSDPEARSQLIWRTGQLGVDARLLIERLEKETDASARRALILSLGEYTALQIPADRREPLTAQLVQWYRDDPDPGVHGAIDWLLRQGKEGPAARPLDWGQARELERIDSALKQREPEAKRDWYVNGQGQTMVVIRGPGEFLMGSTGPNQVQIGDETQHRRRIGRGFAIASTPVTVEQFLKFRKDHQVGTQWAPTKDCPVNNVSWHDAAAYCNWLSEQEGIPKEEWCYPEKISEGMKPAPDYLKKKGYRLPTEAEWEYACGLGATSSRSYGSSDELLPRYAWYAMNSNGRSWPVGQKRPNDLGLFDMHGNVCQWCQDKYGPYPQMPDGKAVEDVEDLTDVTNKTSRSLRSGAFDNDARNVRRAYRYFYKPSFSNNSFGFRPARTCD